MISSLASSSFTSTTCSAQEQGGIVRKLKPLTQIKGLNLRYREPKKSLLFNIPKRCSSKISASLPHNLGMVEKEAVSSNKDSLTTCAYSATAEPGDSFAQQSDLSISTWTLIMRKLNALYMFTRPYTIYGTIVGILSISTLPIQSMSDFSPEFFRGVLKAIIPTVLINIYMCGVNQLVDIGIDKINKPFLPLASGEFSMAVGTAITALAAVSSLYIGAMYNSKPLLLGILSIFFIATGYSVDLPLLRWKTNPVLACISIIGIRALSIPLGFFAHAQTYILGRPLVYTKPIIFTVAFMTIIATVIAVIKDLPDEEGDAAFGIESPSITYGRDKVFWSCVYVMLATYGGAALLGSTAPLLINKIVTVLGHGFLATILWNRAKSVNIKEPSETLAFYLFVWQLLYAEYFLIPFVR